MAQTTPNTPLARRTAAFGSKSDLINKVKSLATEDLWISRQNDDKSWAGISNAKLIRLHDILTLVKDKYGSREKLIDALVSAHGRGKDADYKKHFAAWPLPRLLDALRSAERRNGTKNGDAGAAKAAAPKAKPAADKAEAAAKKPAAKKTAAKKTAAKSESKSGAKPAAKKTAAKKTAKKG
jgi:hypothetical protein